MIDKFFLVVLGDRVIFSVGRNGDFLTLGEIVLLRKLLWIFLGEGILGRWGLGV